MDRIPKNDGYAELSPLERKLLCDADALGEYAERALNDPTILAGRDALQEEFRLEREAKPVQRRLEIVRRKLESVNFFVSPHKDSPSITLGVNLGRFLEVTLAGLLQVPA